MECLSGGASGADYAWVKAADARGVNVKVMSFPGHKYYRPKGTIGIEVITLTPNELAEADPYIENAAEFLHKTPPNKSFVRKLIQRNYFQIKTSEAVFAVGELDGSNRTVLGGTGWACAMATELGIPIYVFSQIDKVWYYWKYQVGGIKSSFQRLHTRPNIDVFDIWTGIGTRKLIDHGREEIKAITSQIPVKVNKTLQKLLNY